MAKAHPDTPEGFLGDLAQLALSRENEELFERVQKARRELTELRRKLAEAEAVLKSYRDATKARPWSEDDQRRYLGQAVSRGTGGH